MKNSTHALTPSHANVPKNRFGTTATLSTCREEQNRTDVDFEGIRALALEATKSHDDIVILKHAHQA